MRHHGLVDVHLLRKVVRSIGKGLKEAIPALSVRLPRVESENA